MGFDEPKALNPDITGWECEREESPDGKESFRTKMEKILRVNIIY